MRIGMVMNGASTAGRPDENQEVEDAGDFEDEVASVRLLRIGMCVLGPVIEVGSVVPHERR